MYVRRSILTGACRRACTFKWWRTRVRARRRQLFLSYLPLIFKIFSPIRSFFSCSACCIYIGVLEGKRPRHLWRRGARRGGGACASLDLVPTDRFAEESTLSAHAPYLWVQRCDSPTPSPPLSSLSGPLVLGYVPLHVEGQVVAPGKGPLAHLAFERLGPGVLPVVAGQLVRPGESPCALWPVARVGLLAWKRLAFYSLICLQTVQRLRGTISLFETFSDKKPNQYNCAACMQMYVCICIEIGKLVANGAVMTLDSHVQNGQAEIRFKIIIDPNHCNLKLSWKVQIQMAKGQIFYSIILSEGITCTMLRTCVDPLMGFKVGTFCVDFCAA